MMGHITFSIELASFIAGIIAGGLMVSVLVLITS